MAEGSVIYMFCDLCEEETPHRILKGKLGTSMEAGFDGTVQCVPCRSIHKAHIDVEIPIGVISIISTGASSEKTSIEFFPREMIKVGEELIWDDHNLIVTSLESNGKRLKKAEASEVDCIWLKTFDSIDLKIAIVQGANTRSEKIDAAPEEEFAVGDLIELGKIKVVITKIRIMGKMIYSEGSPVEARKIVRVYTRKVNMRDTANLILEDR